MLSKLGFLLLLICVVCVLLLAFMDRNLWPQVSRAGLIHISATYSTASRLEHDRNRIIIEPSCNATLLAWIVTSYAGDPSARSALRRAYANKELEALGVRRVFLLGTLDDDTARKTRVSRNALMDESRRFGDVLQGDFLDMYKNLTRKHLMGLRWAVKNCKRVTYIIKMDDDIVIDLYGILEKLRLGMMEDEDSIAGYVLRNMMPIREPANKWYVSETEYAGSVYPDFVSGWLYIMRPRVAKWLLERTETSDERFWIDDVFVTGVMRLAANAKLQDISRLYTTDYRYLECCMKGRLSRLKCEFLVGPNGGDANLQVRFKEFAESCRVNCTARTESNLVGRTCVAAYKEPILRAGTVQIDAVKIL